MSTLPAHSTPQFLPGVRLHRDRARKQWVVLAPERVVTLDDVAYAILQRCDGQRTLSFIIDELAHEFDAAPAQIHSDVCALIDELIDKRILQV